MPTLYPSTPPPFRGRALRAKPRRFAVSGVVLEWRLQPGRHPNRDQSGTQLGPRPLIFVTYTTHRALLSCHPLQV